MRPCRPLARAAREKLAQALTRARIDGIETNLSYLVSILGNPEARRLLLESSRHPWIL